MPGINSKIRKAGVWRKRGSDNNTEQAQDRWNPKKLALSFSSLTERRKTGLENLIDLIFI
jgi:hypothetical protein